MNLGTRPTDPLLDFQTRHPGQRFVRNGLALHYLDEGSGDPVVMVHGNPTWSFYFRNLAEALAPSHRVIVPDHIGCGRSDKPGDDRYDYTLSRRVDDLEALLDHCDVSQGITLVLHDWGGMIGLGFAARHPKRIARLILLNTAGFPLPKSKPFPWPLWICRNTSFGAALVRGGNAFCRVAARVCAVRHRLTGGLRAAYLAPYDSWENRIAVLRFVQDIPLGPEDRSYPIVAGVAESLAQFQQTPTLIGWGLRDFVFDRHFLDEWRLRMPHAEVHAFADSGHYILEDRGEEMQAAITQFLQKNPIRQEVG